MTTQLDPPATGHKNERTTSGQTHFGRVLADLRARYAFRNQDLTTRLSSTDIQQLSRMSSSAHAIRATSPERQVRLAEQTAAAIGEALCRRWSRTELPSGLVDRAGARLLSALDDDVRYDVTERLRDIVIERLKVMTRRALLKLTVLVV